MSGIDALQVAEPVSHLLSYLGTGRQSRWQWKYRQKSGTPTCVSVTATPVSHAIEVLSGPVVNLSNLENCFRVLGTVA